MIRQRVSLAVAGALVATAAFTAGMASPASAAVSPYDPSFTPDGTDFVGVGSDTIEIVMHALSEAYNATAPSGADEVASWAANDGTADLISLREGHAAVTRPNGSGAGKNLLYVSGGNNDVNYARSSSTLSEAEKGANLQQIPFAVDGLKLAVATDSHAPATITPAEMVKIYDGTYTNWSQLGGTSGVIVPLIPQSGSGTRSFFESQLKAANGGNTVNYPATIQTTQEHDPAPIAANLNAVGPFSTARAQSASGIELEKGFGAYRAVYNVVRNTSLGSSTVTNFFGPSGFICSPAGKALIEADGFYALAASGTGAVCGSASQAAPSTFVISTKVPTETSLTAESKNNSKVALKAVVSAPEAPVGAVQFSEDGDNIGSPVAVAKVGNEYVATATQSLVAPGHHDYEAEFVPTTSTEAFSSTGTGATDVATPSQVSVALLNPDSTYGSSRFVAIQATVDGEIPADGQTVSIKLDANTVATVPLINGSGAAFYTLPGTTALGAHTVTATLTGAGFTTATKSANLSVSPATTSSTLVLSPAKIKKKKATKAVVYVSVNGSDGSVAANGTVYVFSAGKVVGVGTVTNGVAIVPTAKFKKKSKPLITAQFVSSSGNYGSSVAAPVRLTVK